MVYLTTTGQDDLDRVIAQGGEDPKLPGFIFGATTAEGEIYFREGGFKTLDDPSSGKITPESVFWICSQTKLITHLAALQLIERGRLHIDDAVSDYVDQLTDLVIVSDSDAMKEGDPAWVSAKEVVRIRHLLNFTSGMYYPVKGMHPERQLVQYSAPHDRCDPVGGFFKLVKGSFPGIPLQFEPGSDFNYGFSSDVLGFVIEKVTGVTLEEYFKEHIFDPLGMKSTTFYLTPELAEKKVPLNVRRDGKLEPFDPTERIFETHPDRVYLRLGGVGLYSTPRDYLTLLRHLLQIHAGTASNAVFSKEIVASLFTPSLDEEAERTLTRSQSFMDPSAPWGEGAQWSTAFALNTVDWPGRRKKYSGCWFGWANTRYFIDPTSGVGAVLYMQVIPTLDGEIGEYAAQLERVLYAGLQSK